MVKQLFFAKTVSSSLNKVYFVKATSDVQYHLMICHAPDFNLLDAEDVQFNMIEELMDYLKRTDPIAYRSIESKLTHAREDLLALSHAVLSACEVIKPDPNI